jgi:hypothetical protein
MSGTDPELAHLERTPAEKMAAAVRPAGGIAWGAAEIMHLTGMAPGTAEMILGTAALTGLAWGLSAGREKVPDSLPWWAAIGGTWFTAAAELGPFEWWPAPVLSIAWGIFTVAASRAAHRHEDVISAREWRDSRAAWLGTRGNWGLGGSHLLEFERTRLGELYTVSTKGTGKRASHHVGRALEEVIAEAEDLPLARVRVMRHSLAGRIRISVRRVDPWAEPLLHPLVCEEPEVELPAARSIRVPVLVGQDPETGEVLEVPLWDEVGAKNVSVTGIAGAGKGVLLDDISEWVTAAPDAIQVRINLSDKGYAEIESWGPACHLTAFGPDQKARAVRVLDVIAGVIAWRARTYKRGQYQPSPSDPLVVVIGDESDVAAAVPAVKKGLDVIATKGREYGVAYVHAGQRNTHDYNSAKQRSQDTVRCTGAVNSQNEARRAAGNMGQSMPDMASYGEGRPGVWSIARNGTSPRTGRTWVFAATAAAHGAEVERIAQERAFTQPELPAACQEYLGDAYAALLATEVFARWARARDPGGFPPETDGGMTADGEPAAPAPPAPEPGGGTEAAAPAPKGAVLTEEDPLRRWEMDMDDRERGLLDALSAKLGGVRQMLAETAAMPKPPELPPQDREAATAEAWHQVGERAEIPEESRPELMRLLGQGTTAPAVAAALGVSGWKARTYLERLRNEGAAYVDGVKKAARWRLAPPPAEGDAP